MMLQTVKRKHNVKPLTHYNIVFVQNKLTRIISTHTDAQRNNSELNKLCLGDAGID